MKTSFRLFSLSRPLNPAELLKTIQGDSGMTAAYYANRYFGSDRVMEVNHLLWGTLKRYGRIYHERGEDPDAPPRWFPTFGAARVHRVRWHNSEEEDLSVLDALKNTRSEVSEGSDLPDASAQDKVSFGNNTNNEGAENENTLEVEMAIAQVVKTQPGKDIQYYIECLPPYMKRSAPLAFKRLRESGTLKREFTSTGTFIWR